MVHFVILVNNNRMYSIDMLNLISPFYLQFNIVNISDVKTEKLYLKKKEKKRKFFNLVASTHKKVEHMYKVTKGCESESYGKEQSKEHFDTNWQ